MHISVTKRDGSVEPYDANKIIRVVKAAGLTDDEAARLADSVSSWLSEIGKEDVTSVQIRDVVIVEIQKINPTVAKKFIWYEMQRDKNFGLS